MTGTGVAPGKVILLGEHAVVYGARALAVAVDLRFTAWLEVEPGGVSRRLSLHGELCGEEDRLSLALAACLRTLSAPAGRYHFRFQSQIPIGCGMGSSAALGVASVRALEQALALALSEQERFAAALAVERVFHGNPSGVDVAVVLRGGMLAFNRGQPPTIEPLRPAVPLHLALIHSGAAGETGPQVQKLARARREQPQRVEALLTRLGELSLAGEDAARRGDLAALGAAMDGAHAALSSLDLSTPALDEVVTHLRAGGAVGAKLTGAGGGGLALGLARDAAHARALVGEADLRGLQGWPLTIPGGS